MEEPKELKDEAERFPLDDVTIKLYGEIVEQQQKLQAHPALIAMQALQNQWQGAFVLFLRQHELSGNWRVADNGREIVRQPDAPANVPQQR